MAEYLTARDAAQVVADALTAELASTYAATFAPYGGAQVVFADDEPDVSERAGVPCVVLNIESDAQSEAFRIWSAYDAALSATVEASEFSGARTGAANTEGADTKLSRALAQVLEAQYATLRDAGLISLRMGSEAERISSGDSDPPLHQDPHRILFTYQRP